jgi:hypothetical protein
MMGNECVRNATDKKEKKISNQSLQCKKSHGTLLA